MYTATVGTYGTLTGSISNGTFAGFGGGTASKIYGATNNGTMAGSSGTARLLMELTLERSLV